MAAFELLETLGRTKLTNDSAKANAKLTQYIFTHLGVAHIAMGSNDFDIGFWQKKVLNYVT